MSDRVGPGTTSRPATRRRWVHCNSTTTRPTFASRAGAAAGDAAVVELAAGSGLSIVNHVRTVAAEPGGPRGSVDVQRRIDRPEIEISGMIPVGAEPISRTVAVLNPTLYFAQSLKTALIARGIPVTGEAVDGDDVGPLLEPQGATARRVLVTTTSAPLRDVATVLMKVSQNQYAETLLKALGTARGGAGDDHRRSQGRDRDLPRLGDSRRCLRHFRRLGPVALQLRGAVGDHHHPRAHAPGPAPP